MFVFPLIAFLLLWLVLAFTAGSWLWCAIDLRDDPFAWMIASVLIFLWMAMTALLVGFSCGLIKCISQERQWAEALRRHARGEFVDWYHWQR
jgi:hypothetical protein